MSAFEQAFGIIVGFEGGYDTTRSDPGNWTGGAVNKGDLHGTKYGISAAAYPKLDIQSLALADAEAIYRRDYWDKVRGDDLPPPFALLVFDAAVNNGVQRAVGWLQMAAGVTVDFQLGDTTLAAVRAAKGADLCAEFLARRMAFMATLTLWKTDGLGWARRLCALPYKSMMMTGG